jgi:two-component system, NtrC family, sensor kinase
MGFARAVVKSFNAKETELATTFANQAVIAIENARLLNVLSQSLEQQTATSEVLQVISSSPGDLRPVFESLLRNATQLCKAKFGTLYLREEGGVRLVAAYDMPAKFYEVQSRAATEPAPGGPLEGALKTKRAVQIPDLAATELYRQRHPRTVDAVELGRIRTAVTVPMLKDDEPIGVISIHRPEVALFDEKQIALLTSFAAQAVIAIENARLLTELRESLQEQTATSEVLQVISSSPGDLEPVFGAMLEKAVRICDANFGNIYRWDGEVLHLLASHNTPPALAKARKHSPLRPYPETPLPRFSVTFAVSQASRRVRTRKTSWPCCASITQPSGKSSSSTAARSNATPATA